ncbi:hypothetical protein C8R46DRAFT_1272102 [Mycena filopes]|nr:hypothetical protein C8R46DRAFT_1272102 [Mycena filopes]
MSSLLTQLFCCCLRPRPAPLDVESTVIPNEHSRLLEPPASPASVVDHQSLSDRLGTIVRAKEGKMVSVSARTPFTLHDAPEQLPSSSSTTSANRRPPILTMTPACSHGSLNLHSDSQSQSQSRSRSRPSSRSDSLASSPRRAAHSPLPPVPAAPPSASASGSDGRNAPVDSSEWFVESESEALSGEDDHEDSDDIVPEQTPRPTPAADPQSIAFDWDA